MSAISPGRLLEVQGVGDPVSILQDDLEILNEELFEIVPSYQSGSPTTVIGPPVTGAHILDERWKDKYNAEFRCTVAGTPGTWRQEKPGVVASPPGSGTIPDNYLIVDAADRFRVKQHLGSYFWVPIESAWEFLSGLTGGTSGKLDQVPSLRLAVGQIVIFVVSTTLVSYRLRAGTDAESSPAIIRPDDYAGTTNEKVWEKVL